MDHPAQFLAFTLEETEVQRGKRLLSSIELVKGCIWEPGLQSAPMSTAPCYFQQQSLGCASPVGTSSLWHQDRPLAVPPDPKDKSL